MSSLMQFKGKITRKGVHLEAYLGRKWDLGSGMKYEDTFVEPYTCKTCGKVHPIIHIFVRKPRGMFGPWVIFEYNGEKQVPDLSCPLEIGKMPRDAKRLTEEESSKIWHS